MRLAATLPGSTYAIAATNAGPSSSGVRRGLRYRASQALMGIDEQAGPDHLSAQRHPRQRFPELFVLLGADSRASPSSGEDFDEAGFDGQDALQFL